MSHEVGLLALDQVQRGEAARELPLAGTDGDCVHTWRLETCGHDAELVLVAEPDVVEGHVQ